MEYQIFNKIMIKEMFIYPVYYLRLLLLKIAETITEEKKMPRAKGKESRTDAEIMTEKANRIGSIIERQLVNLKKMQRNASKSKNIPKYNAMMEHLSNKFLGLKMDADTEISESKEGFDIDSLKLETED